MYLPMEYRDNFLFDDWLHGEMFIETLLVWYYGPSWSKPIEILSHPFIETECLDLFYFHLN